MTLRVLDIETTGTNPETDRVVEIASVDVTRERTITNAQQHLVNPLMPIPPLSSAVHHIIDADVAEAPSFDVVLPDYLGATFLIAHNAQFEQSFLERHGLQPWVCTYKSALRVWPDWPSHSNQYLRYRLGLVEPMGHKRASIDPHRALSDCIVTAAIFIEITKIAKWKDIVAWSAEPPLSTYLNFGKYKGKRWDDPAVDDGYLDWILKSEMDEGAKFSAAHWKLKRAQKRAA